MSQHWLVRATREPGFTDIVLAADEVASQYGLRSDDANPSVVLVDDSDVPLVWIQPARQLADVGAAEDQFGHPAAPGHDWWAEVSAADGGEGARLSEALARALATQCAGTVDALHVSEGVAQAPPPTADATGSPCDLVTERVALLLCSGPVIGLSPAIAMCQNWAASRGLWLVLMTPDHTRVTGALRERLEAGFGHWVVDSADRFYDGLTGRQLEWDAATFAPREKQEWAAALPSPDRVRVEAEIVHPAEADIPIGQLTHDVHSLLGWGPPATLGLLEPPEAVFDPALARASAQEQAPDSTLLFTFGPSPSGGVGVEGSLHVAVQPIGVVERVRVEGPWHPGQVSLDDVVAECRRRRMHFCTLWPHLGGPAVTGSEGGAPTIVYFDRARYPGIDPEELRQLGASDVVEAEVAIADDHCHVHFTANERDPWRTVLGWTWLAGQLALHDTHLVAARAAAEGPVGSGADALHL